MFSFDKIITPIFAKECLEIARRPRYYFQRCLVASVMLLAMLSVWSDRELTTARIANTAGAENGIRVQSRFSSAIFEKLAITQFVLVYLLVPLTLCSSIAEERRIGALDLLLTTDLSNWEIILGKLGSRTVTVLLLVLGSTPLLFATQLMGAVPILKVIYLVWTLALAVLFAGALSTMMSVLCNSAVTALLATYGVLAASSFLVIANPVGMLLNVVLVESTSEALFLATQFIPCVLIVIMIRVAIAKIRDPERMETASKYWSARRLGARSTLEPGVDDDNASPAMVFPDDEEFESAFDDLPEVLEPTGIQAKKALWGPLRIAVDEDDPSLKKNLWVFGFLAISFGFCFFIQVVENPVGSGNLGGVLLPIWVLVFAATALLGITNPLFIRRPGFFDILLQTPLDSMEVLQGAVLVSWPVLLRMYVVPWLFSLLWIGGNPIGLIASAVVGTCLGFLILALGNLCSLVDSRMIPRMMPTILFPIILVMLPAYLDGFRDYFPFYAQAILVAVFLLLARRQVRKNLTSAWTAAYFCAVYFALMTLFVSLPAWWYNPDPVISPIIVVSPYFWLREILWNVPDAARYRPYWLLLIGYCGAIIVQVIWVWRWSAVNFDFLIGRSNYSERIAQQTRETMAQPA